MKHTKMLSIISKVNTRSNRGLKQPFGAVFFFTLKHIIHMGEDWNERKVL